MQQQQQSPGEDQSERDDAEMKGVSLPDVPDRPLLPVHEECVSSYRIVVYRGFSVVYCTVLNYSVASMESKGLTPSLSYRTVILHDIAVVWTKTRTGTRTTSMSIEARLWFLLLSMVQRNEVTLRIATQRGDVDIQSTR